LPRVLYVVCALLGAALAYGAVTVSSPVAKAVFCASLVSFVMSGVLASRIERPRAKHAATLLERAATGALVLYAALAVTLGGGAMNGRAENGQHYLHRDGRDTLVTAAVYYAVAGAEALLFALIPAVVILGTRGRVD
jgi:hypothetical protein